MICPSCGGHGWEEIGVEPCHECQGGGIAYCCEGENCVSDNEGRALTYGEKRVRLTFNPSNNPAVDQIKRKTAELIDLVGRDFYSENPANADHLAVTKAQELYEAAAMWACKAATAR